MLLYQLSQLGGQYFSAYGLVIVYPYFVARPLTCALIASSQLPHPLLPHPQALYEAKQWYPLLLSVFEIAADHLGSILFSQAAEAKITPEFAKGEPIK